MGPYWLVLASVAQYDFVKREHSRPLVVGDVDVPTVVGHISSNFVDSRRETDVWVKLEM